MCYHSFRPEPVPAPPERPRSAVAVAAAPADVAVVDPLTAPLPLIDGGQAGPRPPAGPGERPATAAAVTWPCPACGASVPIDRDGCDSCGAGFLAPAKSRLSLRLPVVGDVVALTQAQRLFLAMVVGCGLVVVLVLLAAVGGSFL